MKRLVNYSRSNNQIWSEINLKILIFRFWSTKQGRSSQYLTTTSLSTTGGKTENRSNRTRNRTDRTETLRPNEPTWLNHTVWYIYWPNRTDQMSAFTCIDRTDRTEHIDFPNIDRTDRGQACPVPKIKITPTSTPNMRRKGATTTATRKGKKDHPGDPEHRNNAEPRKGQKDHPEIWNNANMNNASMNNAHMTNEHRRKAKCKQQNAQCKRQHAQCNMENAKCKWPWDLKVNDKGVKD